MALDGVRGRASSGAIQPGGSATSERAYARAIPREVGALVGLSHGGTHILGAALRVAKSLALGKKRKGRRSGRRLRRDGARRQGRTFKIAAFASSPADRSSRRPSSVIRGCPSLSTVIPSCFRR